MIAPHGSVGWSLYTLYIVYIFALAHATPPFPSTSPMRLVKLGLAHSAHATCQKPADRFWCEATHASPMREVYATRCVQNSARLNAPQLVCVSSKGGREDSRACVSVGREIKAWQGRSRCIVCRVRKMCKRCCCVPYILRRICVSPPELATNPRMPTA